jgi:hypothetical protein
VAMGVQHADELLKKLEIKIELFYNWVDGW